MIEAPVTDFNPPCPTTRFSWIGQTHRTWSLRELLEKNAQDFIEITMTLYDLSLASKILNEDAFNDERVSASEMTRCHVAAVRMAEQCQKLGARVSLQAARRAARKFGGSCEPIEVAHIIQSTIHVFYDEMESWHALIIDGSEAELMGRGATGAVGEDVLLKFEGIQDDLDEACKCLALGRSTATVFHLMRVMESTVRQWATSLGIPLAILNPSGTTLRDVTWHDLLKAVREKVDALPRSTVFENDRLREQNAAFGMLESMRIAWRNQTMHPAESYTEAQAKLVFMLVTEFLPTLAELV